MISRTVEHVFAIIGFGVVVVAAITGTFVALGLLRLKAIFEDDDDES
jgi:hypothetical protein